MTEYEKAASKVAKALKKDIIELTAKDILEYRRSHGRNGRWCGIRLELQNIRAAMYAGLDFNKPVPVEVLFEYATAFPERCDGFAVSDEELKRYAISDEDELFNQAEVKRNFNLESEVTLVGEWLWRKEYKKKTGTVHSEDYTPKEWRDICKRADKVSYFDIIDYRKEMKGRPNLKKIIGIIKVCEIRERVIRRTIPDSILIIYDPLALSFEMMYHAASLLDIGFKWLSSVKEPLPHNFTEEYERCYKALVEAKSYLDSKGAKYPNEFAAQWKKLNDDYKNKRHVLNLGDGYDYQDIQDLRNICSEYGIDASGYSDYDLWIKVMS